MLIYYVFSVGGVFCPGRFGEGVLVRVLLRGGGGGGVWSGFLSGGWGLFGWFLTGGFWSGGFGRGLWFGGFWQGGGLSWWVLSGGCFVGGGGSCRAVLSRVVLFRGGGGGLS